ncbi:phospholipase D-like domain-containing protein [Oculatella sp. LEGE 06141]|uniref:phospholipase D-like domain-containing protein n=1 Tax=Oculatella sp. LEGE 06141 TaxID=1828648 RepID=UPI0030DAD64E
MRLLSKPWVGVGVLLGLGAVLCLGISSRKQSAALTPLLEPLPQDPLIQVYFNHSQAAAYTEPYRQQERLGDDLEQVVVEAIATAQTSIDVASHEFRLPRIAQALREKQQAGVRVRVIVENEYRQPWTSLTPDQVAQLPERQQGKYLEAVQLADRNGDGQLSQSEIDQGDALVILQTGQIPLIDDTADGSKGSDLMHHKFVVIDRQRVLVASANLTTSDVHGDFASEESQGNANHLIAIANPDVAQLFAQEFEVMWGDGPGGNPDSLFGLKKPYRSPQTVTVAPGSTVTVQFSPTSPRLPWQQSANGLIGRALNTATRSADLALFVFSEQNLSNLLQTKHSQGVQIRALIDPGFAYRNYSEALDMMGISLADDRCRYEAENQPWTSAIATVGIPNLPEGDILHHKFGLVDGHLVITGSQNWSNAANEGNDENVLVIDNPTVAAHFEREFDRLYSTATLGVPTWLQGKVRERQTQCNL